MSQQINLLNPAFRKTFDWLAATPVVIATAVLLVIIVAANTWASMRAAGQERAANQRAELLKAAQARLVTLSKSATESKPNQQLAAELANARALLKSREEIMKVLEGGGIGSTDGFAEFLRGFARQTPSGLWLTGFTIGAEGKEIEIHGRMLNPASLPEYIRRLQAEPAFQGRSFASLTIDRPEEQLKPAAIPGAMASQPAKELPPIFLDFVLMPGPSNPNEPAKANAPDLPGPVGSALLPGDIDPAKLVNGLAKNLSQPAEKKP